MHVLKASRPSACRRAPVRATLPRSNSRRPFMNAPGPHVSAAHPEEIALPDWRDLPLRAQVSQLLVMHGSKSDFGLPADDGPLEKFLERYPIGAIFVGGEVIEDGSNHFDWVRERVEQIRRFSRVPILVSADLENGGGDVIPGLTPLPYPMALGAANDPELAAQVGRATAREGALAGINWALAPMADLNLHPLSSNVGPRAFGDSAQRVTPLLRAFCRGMQDEGMAACAKTFPGDGSDYRDQHLVTTRNLLGRDDWQASYGAVFQSLIDDGVATIMTGHLSFPAWQKHELPCTICPDLTTGLLKERMGFRGMVVTDAFGMGGIRNHRASIEGAVESFAAGHDMLLWPDHRFIDRVVEKLERGEIPMSRLEDALTRIWRVKARYARPLPRHASATAACEEVALETARKALTLMWDRGPLLPLTPRKTPRILLIGTTPHDKAFARFGLLAEHLRARGFTVDIIRHIAPGELGEREKDYDVLLFCLERQFHRPLGPMELFGEDARNLWSACMCGREKTIAVGFGSPYLIPWYFETASTAINAYSAVPACQEAVAAALCGEAGFPGTMPVHWENRTSIRSLDELRP